MDRWIARQIVSPGLQLHSTLPTTRKVIPNIEEVSTWLTRVVMASTAGLAGLGGVYPPMPTSVAML